MALYEHDAGATGPGRLRSTSYHRYRDCREERRQGHQDETWGLKNLAYKIDRNRKAHFVMLNIEGPGAVVEELERQTRINDDVIRYMTIRVEEHEEGPSVMMRKNERDAKKRRDREERN